MISLEFLKRNKVCNHVLVRPDVDFAYCPDCGELIANQWYLVRCACCGVKLRGISRNGNIVPEKHFCHNCGTREFIVERINKINFIDINYAVLMKIIVTNDFREYTQSWVDTNQKNNDIRLLLQQHQ